MHFTEVSLIRSGFVMIPTVRSPAGSTFRGQNAWEKLDKYYSITDDIHFIYAAATLFNPTRRKTYFDNQWTTPQMKKFKDKMIATVRKVWEQEYRNEDLKEIRPPETAKLHAAIP
jgi:hypothetical protein